MWRLQPALGFLPCTSHKRIQVSQNMSAGRRGAESAKIKSVLCIVLQSVHNWDVLLSVIEARFDEAGISFAANE